MVASDSIKLFIKLGKIFPDDNEHSSLALPCRHGNHPRRQNIPTGARRWITEYFESAGETFALCIKGEIKSRLKQYFYWAQIELCGWLSGIWCLFKIFSEKRFGVRGINFWYLFLWNQAHKWLINSSNVFMEDSAATLMKMSSLKLISMIWKLSIIFGF